MIFSFDLGGIKIREILRMAVRDFLDDDMTSYAAALAYQALFSVFPFIIFLLALVGFLNVPDFFRWLHSQAALILPSQAMGQVDSVIAEIQSSDGELLSAGILLALWTASGGVRSTMHALNMAYDVEEGRPLWFIYGISMVYTVGLAILLVAAAGLMIIGPEIATWIAGQFGFETQFDTLWQLVRWPVAMTLLVLAVALIYYVAPDVEQEFRFITPGSVIAVIVWIVASLGFAAYVGNFADYNATYGSIGAVIILMFYFYLSSAVLLFGAEINAVIEHSSRQGKAPGEKKLPSTDS